MQIVDPGYLKCLNNENVELISDPIDTVTEKGIKTKNGTEYPLDVLILGTGFDVVSRHCSYLEEVHRLTSGIKYSLSEAWVSMSTMQRANVCLINGRNKMVHRHISGRESLLWSPLLIFVVSLLSTESPAPVYSVVSGFPNFYVLLGPNVATGHTSAIAHIESQIHYVVEMVRAMQKYNVSAFQLRKSAEDDYNKWLHKKLDNTVWNGGCESWYRLPNGKVVATVCLYFHAAKLSAALN